MAAEQVAEQLEEVAQLTREIDTRVVGFFLGGISMGAAIGFFFGYRFNREKIRAEAFKQSEEEIAKIREVYQQKILAAQPKPTVEEVMEERGYSVAVSDEEIQERPLRPPVPIVETRIEERILPPQPPYDPTKRIFRSEGNEKDKMEGWSFPNEMMRRTRNQPYIIHQDEFAHNESEYAQVTYVYYAGDDVLTDEDETPILDRNIQIDPNMLTRFGHGTDDYNILYVRNPVLELDIEICRDPRSYEEVKQELENESHNVETE